MASTPGCRLGAEDAPISTLALTQLIDTGGTYPQPGQGPATNVMAMVRTLTYGGPAFGAPSCEGQLLAIPTHQALFSLLGLSYGGDGRTQFALPNLHGLIASGGGPNQGRTQWWQAMTYLIAANGAAASAAFPMPGAIGLFAAVNPPAGWLVADGSLVPLRDNVALFETIGTTFGGDGISVFALPDLRGRAALGTGQGPVAQVRLGQVVEAGPDTPVAGLGLNYLVNVSGSVPPSQGNGGFPDSASVLGEVVAFAGPSIPPGWLPADGREMTIADNQLLFDLIGTSFGGDGKISFALPDLRTNMVEGL
jgi:microcystin-dependent protein